MYTHVIVVRIIDSFRVQMMNNEGGDVWIVNKVFNKSRSERGRVS